MENTVLNNEMMRNENQITQSIKKLNKAELVAWALFVGVGITYVILSLILPNNVG
ncbi:MAG: hypothetical protein ACI857_001873 [Arenicella sp.]|jgi:hypothetical protein